MSSLPPGHVARALFFGPLTAAYSISAVFRMQTARARSVHGSVTGAVADASAIAVRPDGQIRLMLTPAKPLSSADTPVAV
jgi:hypothetical protein